MLFSGSKSARSDGFALRSLSNCCYINFIYRSIYSYFSCLRWSSFICCCLNWFWSSRILWISSSISRYALSLAISLWNSGRCFSRNFWLFEWANSSPPAVPISVWSSSILCAILFDMSFIISCSSFFLSLIACLLNSSAFLGSRSSLFSMLWSMCLSSFRFCL